MKPPKSRGSIRLRQPGLLASAFALGALVMAAPPSPFPGRGRAGAPPGLPPRIVVPPGRPGISPPSAPFVLVAPSGIDDAMILPAPEGIDDAMIHPPPGRRPSSAARPLPPPIR